MPLLLDCTLKPPSLIFPALPHLVHFNAGVLAAMLVRRWTTPGIPVLSSRRAPGVGAAGSAPLSGREKSVFHNLCQTLSTV